VKDIMHIREGRSLSRLGGRRIFSIIEIEVDIKEPHVGGTIQEASQGQSVCAETSW